MVIAGYILTVINYVFYCLSRFAKQKKTMLTMDIFAKICTVASLLCFDSVTGAIVMGIAIPLLIISRYKETHELSKPALWSIFIIFNLIYIVSTIFTYNGISSVLVTITALLTLISIWWLKPQNMRLMGLIVCIIYLAYQISIKNWAGLLEILVIVANVASWIIYKNKEKQK